MICGMIIFQLIAEENKGVTGGNQDEVKQVVNFDILSIITPVNVSVLAKYLCMWRYNETKSQFLLQGFSEGFDIGYRGPVVRQDSSRNLPLPEGGELDVWNKLMTEVELGRVAGPFESIPYSNYMQSLIGLVLKVGNKTHLIFHLSYSFKSGIVLCQVQRYGPGDRELFKVTKTTPTCNYFLIKDQCD